MFRSHYRLSLIGVIGEDPSVPERFSFGVCLAKGNAPGETGGSGSADGVTQPNEGQFDDMVDACTAFFGRAETRIGDHARLTEVKLATIGADGKYTADPKIATVSTPGAINLGAIVQAPQVSLAVSLNTARRGPSGRGRFYLPAPGIFPTPLDLLLPTADVNAVRGSVVAWINDLNDEPGVDVLGLGVTVASTKGFNTPVTGVRVGRALDTVRSRRRALAESYGLPQLLDENPNPANQ